MLCRVRKNSGALRFGARAACHFNVAINRWMSYNQIVRCPGRFILNGIGALPLNLQQLQGLFKMQSDIGIDLGTGYTRIYSGRSIVLNQPSVVTVKKRGGEAVEFGDKAYASIGRTSDRFCSVCPIERGTIANYDVAEKMIKEYLTRTAGKKTVKPRVMITAPSGLTAVQERSIVDAAENAGARNVCLIESPLAAAVEMGVDFSAPSGVAVIDMGKGTTDIAVLSMGGISQCESARVAGIDFDEAIVRYVRHEYNIAIGMLTAERIKKTVGCVKKRQVEIAVTAGGLNQFSGLPEMFEITSTQLYDAISDTFEAILKAIRGVFEKTPPELLADSSDKGMILTGGSSLIYGMPERLSEELNMPVHMPDDPLLCVARGIGKAMADMSMLKNGDYYFRSLQDLTVE